MKKCIAEINKAGKRMRKGYLATFIDNKEVKCIYICDTREELISAMMAEGAIRRCGKGCRKTN